MLKSLDSKLREIRKNRSSKAFIIADAKDADMAFGIQATGSRKYLAKSGPIPAQFSPEVWTREEFGYRSLPEYLEIIREIVDQKVVDIMLMSASVNEQLTIKEGLFKNSPITPAARANDTSDVWAIRHGSYVKEPSKTFRTASIDYIQCGKVECEPAADPAEFPGANLGLYSITYLNDLERDRKALLEFKEFREEAERKRFRYFLEVFDPNVNSGIPADQLGAFINDNIVRTLAGVTEAARPVFLKIVYHGPRFMEELVQYDPNLIVGVLGGSAGTTYDAFKLIHDAQKYGARVALFGRKINNAEHQLAFIEMLRLITDGVISPEEAVHAYHAVLDAKRIKPRLVLERDIQLTEQSMSYDAQGSRRSISLPSFSASPALSKALKPAETTKSPATPVEPSVSSSLWPMKSDGTPDFSKMNSQQRLSYSLYRLNKKYI